MPANGLVQSTFNTGLKRLALFGVAITLLLVMFGTIPADASQRVFKTGAQFSEHYKLPFELQGHWKRTRFIQQSSSPNLFKSIESGEWEIRQVDDMVALTNPANGVRAMATITNIEKDTVTLSLKRPIDRRRWCTETLALTPKGQQLTGQQTKACYKDDSDTPYFYAKAYVKGQKTIAADVPANVYNYLYLGE